MSLYILQKDIIVGIYTYVCAYICMYYVYIHICVNMIKSSRKRIRAYYIKGFGERKYKEGMRPGS